MTTCYLALGSNLKSPRRQIQQALKAIRRTPEVCLKQISPIYQSYPQGVTKLSQPTYFNAVIMIETSLSPMNLLHFCQKLENKHKRLRLKPWGARTMDIDILLYGKRTLNLKHLTVPHPRMHERDFVLVPLLDIWPDAHLPGGQIAKDCLKTIRVKSIK